MVGLELFVWTTGFTTLYCMIANAVHYRDIKEENRLLKDKEFVRKWGNGPFPVDQEKKRPTVQNIQKAHDTAPTWSHETVTWAEEVLNILKEIDKEIGMELKPGRELDAIIAEHVLHQDVIRNGRGPWSIGPQEWHDNAGDMYVSNELPDYSRNIEKAWEVVEELDMFKHATLRQRYYDDKYIISGVGNTLLAESDTVPHAICLAALKMTE